MSFGYTRRVILQCLIRHYFFYATNALDYKTTDVVYITLALQNMVLWKKITIGVLAAFALLLAAGFAGVVWLWPSTSDMCADTLIGESPSPNGKLKAVLFQTDCGATTDFNSHVAIMPINSSLSDDTPGFFGNKSFFAADTNHGQAPAGKSRGPEVRLRWGSDTILEIAYHDLARVIRAEKTSKGVSIDYHTFH